MSADHALHLPSGNHRRGSATRQPLQKSGRKESARKRVEKLEAVLVTLGEEDDIFRHPRSPHESASASTSTASVRTHPSFRQTTVKARESLTEALAAQDKQETLLADGEQRLSQLLLEEKNNLSLFTVPPPLVDASAELSRMQGVINDLQRELARLRPFQPGKLTISARTTISICVNVRVDRRGPREAPSRSRWEWDRCEIASRS